MKFFLWLIFVAGLIGITYFAYPVVKSRYFPAPAEEVSKTKTSDNKDVDVFPDPNAPAENKPVITQEENALKIEIKTSDCEDECERFTQEAELKYCQEACGIKIDPNATASGCDAKSGTEKDYCFKNQAIQEKKFSLCDKISDSGIKKTCKTRVTEELMETGN